MHKKVFGGGCEQMIYSPVMPGSQISHSSRLYFYIIMLESQTAVAKMQILTAAEQKCLTHTTAAAGAKAFFTADIFYLS